jgi:hypothetical protein
VEPDALTVRRQDSLWSYEPYRELETLTVAARHRASVRYKSGVSVPAIGPEMIVISMIVQ